MSSLKLKLLRADIPVGSVPEVPDDALLGSPVIRRRGYQDLVNDVRVNYALRVAIPIPSITHIGCDDLAYTLLLSDGTVWSAGIDGGGNLMQGVAVPVSTDLIMGVTDLRFTSIFRHWEVVGGLDASGQVWFWGWHYGQWGCDYVHPGTPECPSSSTIPIAGCLGEGVYVFSDFSVSYPHAAGVTTDGKIYGQGWTWDFMAPWGVGSIPTELIYIPTQEVLGRTDWVSVFCGWMGTFAIDSSGRLWGAGRTTYGRLGTGVKDDTTQFAQEVLGKTDWLFADLGHDHSIALDTSGRVWVAGDEYDGALGAGISETSTFIQVDPSKYGSKSVVAVCANEYTSYILCGDGTLYATGNNWQGECGLGHFDDPVLDWTAVLGDSYTMISGSNGTVMAAKANSIWYWGYTPFDYGELNVPTEMSWPSSPFPE